ncbi:DUF3821 domain-containing protein [uncultured Methanoregula sp.]|uniref:DUF3821 domain-containing protein n=1 Tax=uncultured Methanoregula sp. TaxID=1005933 RepID=UPI002AAB906F|nr:DUF3821 domain-containing protein [uncultured Methanoregula sp.]
MSAAPFQTIAKGDQVFIGESGLNITGAVGAGNSILWYASGAQAGTDAPSKIIPVSNRASFTTSPSDFSGYTGTWYDGTGTDVAFTVVDPAINIAVWDIDQNKDVSGTTVPAGHRLIFRVDTNAYPAAGRLFVSQSNGYVGINLTDDKGNPISGVYNLSPPEANSKSYDLTKKFLVNSEPWYWGNVNEKFWNTTAMESGARLYPDGTYTVGTRLFLNNISDNYKNDGADYRGKTYQVTTVTIATTPQASEPVAGFSADKTSGTAPLTVQFTDSSTNSPTEGIWDFGDGDTTNATTRNPVHTFKTAGKYTINLTVANAAGSNSTLKSNYITVSAPATPAVPFQTIVKGDQVFIGESGLNVTGVVESGHYISWYASGATVGETSPSKTIYISDNANFTVNPTDFDGYTGTWYTGKDLLSQNEVAFTVVDPAINIAVWDIDQNKDVSGTTVPAGHRLIFKIDTNAYPAASRLFVNQSDGYVGINLTDEKGTHILGVYNRSPSEPNSKSYDISKRFLVNNEPWYWGNPNEKFWNTTAMVSGARLYPDGTYTVGTRLFLNNISDNYKNNGADYRGKTYQVTTVTIAPAVTAPVAAFSTDVTNDIAPLTVQFTDKSTNTPTGWAWFFGDEPYTQAWTQQTASAGWAQRSEHKSVAMADGSIVIMGGYDGTVSKNDVWRSTNNGTSWTQVNASPGWSARHSHSSVVMPDNSIILTGGWDGNFRNDVWRSTDNGVTWTLVTANAGWTARAGHNIVVLPDGTLVLMGGNTAGGYKNDVWQSTNNGLTWTQRTASAAWNAREDPGSVAMPDGSIVLMGGQDSSGYRNDVWRSTDNGASWTQINASAGWAGRWRHNTVVMPESSIVLMGGRAGSTLYNDVWRSTDNGSTWTRLTSTAGWTGRSGSSSVVIRDGSIVLTGGDTTNAHLNDVWRFKSAGSSAQNPTHTYTTAGTYPVTLQAFNDGGFNSTRKAGYISVTESSVPAPVAGFTASQTIGIAPMTVKFNDTSTGSPTSWNWSFGNGMWFNTTNVLLRNATNVYTSPGTYTVRLIVASNAGANTTTRTDYIVVRGPKPVTDFSADITSGLAPLTVSFTDRSSNTPTGWTWFFGDENYTAPWTQQTANAGWSGRSGQSSVVMPDGSIVLIGGHSSIDGVNTFDVWQSKNNGATWVQLIPSSGATARYGQSSVVMPDGSIVLMGGWNGNGWKMNDVWRSTDNGATWTQMTDHAEWLARVGQSSVVMPDGSIVLMGGHDGWGYRNDVWRSTDNGATWIQMTTGAGWSGRYLHSSVAMPDGSIVLMGGQDDSYGVKNDVWRSTDNGATWTQMTTGAGWSARWQHSSVAMPDGSIVLMGGQDQSDMPKNDTWRSTDNGVTWTPVNVSSGWTARYGHSSVVMPDGSIVMMGGWDNSGYKNDVWRFNPAGSSAQNPSHTYTVVGTYPVALQAYNANGFNSTEKVGYIRVNSSGSGSVPFQTIAKGAPVFIGESGLNVTGAVESGSYISWYASGAQVGGTPSKTITVADSTNFFVNPTDFSGFTGIWYAGRSTDGAFTVVDPTISVAVWDIDQDKDVSGTTVPAGHRLIFRIDTNAYPVTSRPFVNSSAGYMGINLTDHSGSHITGVYNISPSEANSKSYDLTKKFLVNNLPWYWGNANEKFWNTSASENGARLYPDGTYSIGVRLFLNNITDNYRNGGADYRGKTYQVTTVTIGPAAIAPVADFQVNTTSGKAPLTVRFNDTSTGSPISWNWSFGDGSFSILQNPAHTYAIPGTYSVNLSATNAAGEGNLSRAGLITVVEEGVDSARQQLLMNTTLLLKGESVQITEEGRANADYYLIIENASVANTLLLTENYPAIVPNQNKVNTSPAASQEIRNSLKEWSSITGPITATDGTMAIITTNNTGKRSIEFTTSSSTKDYTFFFMLFRKSDVIPGFYEMVDQAHVTVRSSLPPGTDPGETRVTSTQTGKSEYAVYGDGVVWTDTRSGYPEIYLLNRTTGTESRITHTDSGKTTPILARNLIVWVDYRDSQPAIYGYALNSQTEFRIESGYSPSIDRNRLVYRNVSNSANGIYLYNLTTGQENLLNFDGYTDYPKISGDSVVWTLQNPSNGLQQFELFNLTTGTKTLLPVTRTGWSYSLNGNRLAYVRDNQIYIYNISTRTESQITHTVSNKGDVTLSGRFIAWIDTRNGHEDIYQTDLQSLKEEPACLDPATQYEPQIFSDELFWLDFRFGKPEILSTVMSVCNPVSAPVASFTASRTSGMVPMTVQFNDTSTGTPAAWLWNFGDGDTTNSSVQNPVHTYATTGSYAVSLTVQNSNGSNTATQPGYISVSEIGPACTVPDQYATIQAAVNAATAGDTITVRSGIYNEQVVIAKPVSLSGIPASGPNRPVINGTGSGIPVTITANHVNLTGFIVANSNDAGVLLKANNALLEDIKVQNNAGDGIRFDTGSSYNTLKNVNTSLNQGSGMVFLSSANNNTLVNCMAVANRWHGMYLWYVANNNVIYNITVDKNNYGITDQGNNGNTFTRITATHNTEYGIEFDEGAYNNILTDSTLSDNQARGVFLFNGPHDNVITNNTITGNNGWAGINVNLNANNNVIYNNYFNNARNYLDQSDSASPSVNIWNVTPTRRTNIIGGPVTAGNYWADPWNTGFSQTNADANTDGICDAQFTLGGQNHDWSPLHTYTPVIPAASFFADSVSGAPPLTIRFTDTSTGFPTAWLWDFGDGSSMNATMKNPVHTFASIGTYTVNLTAANSAGSNSQKITNYITVTAGAVPPVPAFSANTTAGTAPLTVLFHDDSTNEPTEWLWDFGDGSTSNVQDVLHTYTTVGTYAVNLTVTNAAGGSSHRVTNYITVNAAPSPTPTPTVTPTPTPAPSALRPVAAFSADKTLGDKPLTVKFTDLSINSPTGYTWYFGDENFTGPWVQMTSGAEWPARSMFSSVALPDRSILLMGGEDNANNFRNDTWRSTDNGATWVLMNESSGWTKRSRHSSVVLADGSILLTGGYGSDGKFRNDTWRSTDKGATWTQMTANAGWPARYFHSSVVLADGSILLMGGYASDWSFRNDVWRSTDNGATWTQATASAAWSQRQGHSSVVLPDNSIVLMSGYGPSGLKNDTWRSSDNGATWTQMTANAGWPARSDQTCVALPDGSMVLMGGHDGTRQGDTWRSTDKGATWVRVNAGGSWAARAYHNSVATRDGSILLMGGDSSMALKDVWRLSPAGSSAQNPSHTYTIPGTYQVALQAYNAAGSSSTVKPNFITVNAGPLTPVVLTPVASFRSNRTDGDKPLVVKFMDTSSNLPTSWSWDFGDGITSNAQHPVHSFLTTGNYTVNLTAANSAGSSTVSKAGYITVLVPVVEQNTFVIHDVQTVTVGTVQNVTINTGTNVTTSGNVVTISNSSSWSSLAITMKDAPVTGGATLNGTVNAVRAVTEPVTAPIESAGSPTVQIAINMTEMPGTTAAITQTITKDPDTTAQTSFSLFASSEGKQIDDIAYTLNIVKTNLANSGDGGIIQSATLTMTISKSWVDEHGGVSCLAVLRRADDGTTQILIPTVTGPDANDDYQVVVISPKGLSVFSLASVSAVTSSGTTSSVSYVDGGSDSGSYKSVSSTSKSTALLAPVDPSANPWTTQTVNGPTHITKVELQPIGSFSKDLFILTEKPDSLPADIPSPSAPVYELHKIDVYHATSDDVNQAKIEFTVSPSYLDSQKMTYRDVQLFRYHDKTWEKLPTEYIGMKDGAHLYRATTTGFSYFATVLVKDATIVAATTAPTSAVQASATPAAASVQGTVASTVARTQAAPPVTDTPKPSGMAIPFYVFGIAAIIILGAGGFIVRKWWIRKQNPALFRDEPFFGRRR